MSVAKSSSKLELLLQEFTRRLNQCNIMNIETLHDDEYELEAMSILSRFCEGALQFADSEKVAKEYASTVLKQTFKFWFDKSFDADSDELLEPLVSDLVNVYREVMLEGNV